VTKSYDWIDLPQVFFAKEFGATELELLRQGRVRYVIVDRRLSQTLPTLGFYFEPGELNTTPIDPNALAKFDEVRSIHRIFDDGQIIIYDVGLFTGNSRQLGIRNVNTTP
jgi:hypothetical protein